MPRETASDRYSAASGLASAIDEAARQYGVDIDPICKALDIDPATFSDLTGRIGLDRLCRLLETCALLTKDEAFGLKSIDFFRPGSSGPYGFGLLSAPTALDFFRFMGEHQGYISGKSYSRLTIGDQGAEFVWTYSPLIVKRDQFVDMNIGLVIARLRSILGPSIDLIEISMERPKPRNPTPFRERLTRRINYGKRINALRLPPDLFAVANPGADERLFQLMSLQCSALRPERPESPDFADELKEFILARVSDSNISLKDAADYFQVSERTLQRRLAEVGTSLNDLRDEVRRDLARTLLTDTELSAAEIALRLGYSQASAFTRSTVRWFGATPRDYRKIKA